MARIKVYDNNTHTWVYADKSVGATGATGPQGAPGYTPVRGTDYWTEADKQTMVQDVMEALGSPVLGSVDDDNNIILSGGLATGTYNLMYENADGTRTAIGSLKIEGEVQYTNVLKTAEAFDSTDPYNGTGYKNGVYMSGSSPYEGTDEACMMTGYIPYTIPATGLPEAIYIKGSATWESNNHARIRFFINKISYVEPNIQSTGISSYYTVEELGENYIKLTPVASGDTSAIVAANSDVTSTMYIRMSLVGTGDDLIITIGEPIE